MSINNITKLATISPESWDMLKKNWAENRTLRNIVHKASEGQAAEVATKLMGEGHSENLAKGIYTHFKPGPGLITRKK